MSKALIFGATGQTGSYLAEHLLEDDFEVIGVARRTSTPNTSRLTEAFKHENFSLVKGDITDFSSCLNLVGKHKPDWIFNMAAQSHVGTSFDQPIHTVNTTLVGHLNVLESVRLAKPDARLYFAGSSEQFGEQFNIRDGNKYQDMRTPMVPCSPYGVSKMAAHQLSHVYKKSYNMDIRVGILGNHESPRRGEDFVTRKITKYLGYLSFLKSKDKLAHSQKLRLGNLDAKRDWGHAKDYAEGIIKIMEYPETKDFLIGTGYSYTVEQFLCTAFLIAGIENPRDYIIIDQNLKRPMEVPFLRLHADDTFKELNWRPKTQFVDLVYEMVTHDINEYKNARV